MKQTTGLMTCAGAVIALGILPACAATPAMRMNAAWTTAARPRLGLLPSDAAMPVAGAGFLKSKYYEYIGNAYGTYVGIFDYPNGVKEIGRIRGGGGQLCAHALYGYAAKTFWNVAGQDQITEYGIPARPLRTLASPFEAPSSCAMNAAGDLAVGILNGKGGGDVVIFQHAQGTGTVYTTPLHSEYFDGYDPKGDLFADGFGTASTGSSSLGFELVELAAGGSKFVPIATSNAPEFPGSVQWDGTYLVVTDQQTGEMYQYTVSGTTATLQNTLSLTASGDCAQTWIATTYVYCADAGNDEGEVFKYPQGGAIVATFTGAFDTPLGVVATEK